MSVTTVPAIAPLGKDRLREAEVLARIGIKDPRTLYAMGPACPYLDGDPFEPEYRLITVEQENQWGKAAHRYKVKTWTAIDTERIVARRRQIASGRFTDRSGEVLISGEKALGRLRCILPGANGPMLLKWARSRWRTKRGGRTRRGCTYFGGQVLETRRPGFPECPKRIWFLETQIDRLCIIITRLRKGLFFVKGHGLYLSGERVYQKLGWGRSQLARWQDVCLHHPRGQLLPLSAPYGPSNKGGATPVWPWKELKALRASIANGFDGAYREDPANPRYNLARASQESGHCVNSLRRFIFEKCKYHDEGRLPHQRRQRCFAPFIEEVTVSKSDLDQLNARTDALTKEPRPKGDWRTVEEIREHFHDYLLRPGDGERLRSLLHFLEKQGTVERMPIMRPVATQQKRRELWFYDLAAFEKFLGERDIRLVIRKFRGSAAPPQQTEAGIEPAPPVHPAEPERKRRGGGRPTTAKRKLAMKFCYEQHQRNRLRSVSSILAEAKRKYGDDAPTCSSDVTICARRYAEAQDPPLPFVPRS